MGQRSTATFGGLVVAATIVAGGIQTPEAVASGYNFRCFFSTGSDALNARCEQELRTFVRVWNRYRDGTEPSRSSGAPLPPVTYRVIVQGHGDGAEARRGLVILSERRARAVAEWIIDSGLPRNLVSAEGYGATCLLVPTDPGEAEPQNRRVEIMLSDGSRGLLACGRE